MVAKTRRAKTRRLLWGSAAAIGALAVSPAWGTAVCTPASGTYDATIAVAANFYGPAQDLVADFTAVGQPYHGKVIRVCEDSTGALNTAIRGGNPNGYSLFLAANAATPIGLQSTVYVQTGATAKLYAKGVPVLAALYATVPNLAR